MHLQISTKYHKTNVFVIRPLSVYKHKRFEDFIAERILNEIICLC